MSLASDASITIPDDEVEDFRVLVSAIDQAAQHMLKFDGTLSAVTIGIDMFLTARYRLHAHRRL